MVERLGEPHAKTVNVPVQLLDIQPRAAPEALHELRVRVPVHLHRQLLSLKILRGKSLAETISTALDLYFADQARSAHGRAAEKSEA